MQSCHPSQLQANDLFMRHIPEDGAVQNSLCWEESLKESILCLLCWHWLLHPSVPSWLVSEPPLLPGAGRGSPAPVPHEWWVCLAWKGSVLRWEGSLLVQLSPAHLCRAQAQFGGVEGQKAVCIGREWDWLSTCLPKPGSAPFPMQGHQIKPTKAGTCPVLLPPFICLS